jgi:hypothetical protein
MTARLSMSDLERVEAGRDEARAEALRLREFIQSEVLGLWWGYGGSGPTVEVSRERLEALLGAAREALEVQS